MATTADFRNGLALEMDGEIYVITEFQHVKPGKGGAFVRTKLRNVRRQKVIERTFNAGEKVEVARLETREMQFLYPAGDEFVFMDMESYDQIHLPRNVVGDHSLFLKENMVCEVLTESSSGEILDIELPNFVELEIVETDPGLRGDTASGGSKPAKLETGAVVQVPLFISTGERIRVDTRTSKYIERV
ncbi:MAG: elongation factor P [Candidatus Delongbacteria bacterium]|nr:elongation factor P [Candidatus Delongbacteria bacterium]